MKALSLNLGALLAGLVSSSLVVGAIVGLQQAANFNLFSLMWWFVIPAGALVTGMLAASGYYFGAVKLHAKPTKVLGFGMVFVAALTQFALYAARYQLDRTTDGQPVSSIIDFPQYTLWVLSHARYGLSAHGRALGDGVEVGVMGYVIAVLQFLALLAGAFMVYAILADRPYCDACSRYARSVEKREALLGGDDVIAALTQLRAHEALSPEYLAWLEVPGRTGSAGLELEVLECPTCQRRAVIEQPKVLREGKWSYEGALFRTAWASQPRGSTAAQALGFDR